MNLKISTITLIIPLFLLSCEKKAWDEHYNDQPVTVDQDIWEVIQAIDDLSLFTGFIKEFGYDTLFKGDDPYTLFIPTNGAFSQLLDTGMVTRAMLDYHISLHFIQSMNVSGKRKIQTLGEKFALFEKSGNGIYLDDIALDFESPLYRNGKYFTMNKVALPRPNLYEFFAVNNPVLRNYIDDQDSIILDRALSRPLGFDEFGNTVYDSVLIKFNLFEEEFFPVSEEFRNKTATIVFPLADDYNAALDEMAQMLGNIYQDHTDIPLEWQNDILIPYLLEHGVFENMLEEYEFIPHPSLDTLKMKNIRGDSVVIEYEPADKELCSNGYAYNYTSFGIPDTLFTGSYRHEGEWLLQERGFNTYAWKDEVTVISDVTFPTIRELVPSASNDSILKVNFNLGYTGDYSVEFNLETLFPRKYLMVVRTHMYVGGIYDIYVNDELVMTMDYYDYVRNREIWWSVHEGRYLPEHGFNRFDCWIENRLDYGETRIKFVYREPGLVSNNGLVIDYIEFFPFDE
ncbi:MAG: fasciclin domain-containing protein [Bacteroidales bacterium]|nr:fasciclin domain-containing protein [Bacteroidales bacterium]